MKFKISRSAAPNLFTAMNMFCGYYSIVKASESEFILAAWFIIFAGVFDALDGMVARLTHSSSEMGIQLDSLSDLLSFGAAPAFLLYKTYLFQYELWGIILSSLILIAGGFRLARFNVQLVGFEKSDFKGLPIPSSAATISSFVIVYLNEAGTFSAPFDSFVIPIVIALSFLMVSTIKYDSLPKPTIDGIKEKPLQFIFVLISILLVIFTHGKIIFALFVFVISFGIFRHIFYFFTQKKNLQKT